MVASWLQGLADTPEFRFFAAGRELAVVSFTGEEAISQPYRFDVELATDPSDIGGVRSLKDALLGSAAELTVGDRTIGGYLHSVESLGCFEGTGRERLRVRLVPTVWRLSQVHRSRIFQHLSVPEIVTRVLDEGKVEHEWQAQGEYGKRECCVQYQETDLAFVCRILAEEGIFYFFSDESKLVLADQTRLRGSPQALGPIAYRAPSGLLPSEQAIFECSHAQQVLPASCVLRDFNFEKPALDLTANEEIAEQGPGVDRALEIYEHETKHCDPAAGRKRAQVRLEEIRVGEQIVLGASQCRGFAPCSIFELADHPSWQGEFFLVSVSHEGYQRQVLGAEAAAMGPSRDGYNNRFECIPASVPYRPQPRGRRLVQCTETATVVGPKGEEIHTDAHGRVKVMFHWDREGKADENSSCWIRVAQSWAGTGWGFVFLPRVGMEVVVSFLSGDPDRPVIVGSLYNGTHPPPYALPEHKTKSTIKTQTSPGGHGSNELRFEDAKGSEEVYLHAQRDLNVGVEHDHATLVKANQSDTVGGSQTLSVSGNRTKTVTKKETVEVKGDREAKVVGSETLIVQKDRKTTVTLGETLVCKSRGIAVEAMDQLETKDKKAYVSSAYEITTDGKYVLRQGGTTLTLEGGHVSLDAASFVKLVHGSGSLELDAAGKVKVVGGPAVEVESGGCTIKLGSGIVEIAAQRKIVLGVGGSTVELSPAGVTTSGAKLTSRATGMNEIRGAAVKIN